MPYYSVPDRDWETFTFDAVKGLLDEISGGIAVALFTTLVGLIASLILRMQAQFLETSTNTLISELAHLGETDIIPMLLQRERKHLLLEEDKPYERFE